MAGSTRGFILLLAFYSFLRIDCFLVNGRVGGGMGLLDPQPSLPGRRKGGRRQNSRRQTVMKIFGQSDGAQENQEDRARLAAIVESSDDAIIGKTLGTKGLGACLDTPLTKWSANRCRGSSLRIDPAKNRKSWRGCSEVSE